MYIIRIFIFMKSKNFMEYSRNFMKPFKNFMESSRNFMETSISTLGNFL